MANERIRSLSNPRKIMSTPHHEDRLLDIFQEVKEAFPYYDEEKQIEIANKRFEDELI
mgnify:CR=1 FL=1